MYGRDESYAGRLPPSHLFVSVARGESIRTFAVRPFVLWTALALVPLALLWAAGATAYVAFHDDILTALLAHEAEMQTAYEQRISEARAEVDRVASRQLLDQTSFEGRMHDLLSRQARLEQHDRMVEALATQLRPSGKAAPGALDAIDEVVKSKPASGGEGSARAFAPVPSAKPHPVDEPEKGESLSALPQNEADKRAAEMIAAARDPELNASARLGLLDFSLDRVERGQLQSLAGIETRAHGQAARLGAIVARTGLSADQLIAPAAGEVGGPFIPVDADAKAPPFERAEARAAREVALAESLRRLVLAMPVREPLAGGATVSSPFGYRLDPFLGRPALHPGVDLVQAYGSEIHATGAGRVIHAGWAGGYGQMVEVDHGNGIATVYGHMSEVLVAEGATVKAGDTLGRIGSTGRSSGPHLHYEVRLDGEPVDPTRFLEAGSDLASLAN
jgi:murein DD-endopeptidase MepM/ murein hydrolase activator NlpD